MAQLYSVSWYKNYVEFYRFEPNRAAAAASDAGSKQDYKLEGIQVNVSSSRAPSCSSHHAAMSLALVTRISSPLLVVVVVDANHAVLWQCMCVRVCTGACKRRT